MSRRCQIVLVLLFAALAGGRTAFGWMALGATWTPDFHLYTQGGLGWYPSPLGRAIGALGPGVLGWTNVAAATALPLLVALRARHNRPVLAALLAALAPIAWVTGYASVDALACCLLFGALLARSPWKQCLAAASFLTHWALLPFALYMILRRRSWVWVGAAALLVGPAVLYTLLTTDYGGISDRFYVPHAALGFTLTLLVVGAAAVLPLWPVLARRGETLLWLATGAAEAGLQGHMHVRYGLPAALIAASNAGPYRPGFRRAQARLHQALTAAESSFTMRAPTPSLEAPGRRRRGSTPATPSTNQEVVLLDSQA